MREFIARENIQRYQAALEMCADEQQIAVLKELLHEQEISLLTMLGGSAQHRNDDGSKSSNNRPDRAT